MEEEFLKIPCDRIGKVVPITISKRENIVSLCCCYEEGGRDCQHRAEPGCALYVRFSGKGNPIVQDLANVLGWRAKGVYEAIKVLISSGIPFVIGGRDAVNAYCPSVTEETLRTNIFIKSVNRDTAWRALRRANFKIKPVDPTCCIATKGKASIELHYGRPPYKPECLDEETLARAVKVRLIDIEVSLQPLEELIAYKADRYADRDKVDLKRLLNEWVYKIDIDYMCEVARKRGLSLEKLVITERGEVKMK